MNGIFLAIDSNHLSRKDAQAAIAGWNRLNLSIGSLNFYIRDAVKLHEDQQLVPLKDVNLAKLVVGYMIQTAVKRGSEQFSFEAYQEFLKRAKTHAPINFTPIVDNSKPLPKKVRPAIDIDEAEEVIAISKPTPMLVIAKKLKKPVAKPIAAEKTVSSVKNGRGRKFNPNSAQHVAKRLYEESTDKSREAIVKLFQEKLGLPSGTAMTYYYNARKPA